MKKIYLYIATVLMIIIFVSCEEQLRIDERQITHDVQYFTYSRFPFTTAIVNLSKHYGNEIREERMGSNVLYFWDTYNSGDKFLEFYGSPETNWTMGGNPFTDEFRYLAAVTNLATVEGNLATVAAANILKCVIGEYLTEKYGDIPFIEASQGRTGILFPKFDSQKEVYEALFKLLDDAAATLSNPSSQGIPADHDVLFNGNKESWLRFANSLKFRLMVNSYEAFKKAGKDLGPDMQKIAAEGKYMNSVAHNAGLKFPGTIESDSWFLQRTWGTGNDYTEQKPTKHLIDKMVELDDPRMYVIFAPVLAPISSKTSSTSEDIKINGYTYKVAYYPSSNYSATDLQAPGRDLNGNQIIVNYPLDAKWFGNPYPIKSEILYKKSGENIAGENYPYDNRRITGFSTLIAQKNGDALRAVLMESSEMMFLLAEARQKGWISAGTAKQFYEDGIKLSFERWKIENGTKPSSYFGSDKIVDNFSAYYAKAAVALTGGADDLEKIAVQKWLSLLMTNHPIAFFDFRRTGRPQFIGKIAPSFSTYSYPVRYVYPLDESSNNKENYDVAVQGLGGKDLPSSKMWVLNF